MLRERQAKGSYSCLQWLSAEGAGRAVLRLPVVLAVTDYFVPCIGAQTGKKGKDG